MATNETENVRITRLMMQLMSTRQFEEAYKYIDDDIVLDCPYQAFHQGPIRVGIEKYKEGVAFIPYIFSSFELSIHEIYDCPAQDTVVFEQTSTGVLAANGQPFANRYLMVFRFRNGKIFLWREFFNPEAMVNQMATTLAA